MRQKVTKLEAEMSEMRIVKHRLETKVETEQWLVTALICHFSYVETLKHRFSSLCPADIQCTKIAQLTIITRF